MTSIVFFLNTWEEYYVGELNFPIIHGVSEGTLMACACMHVSGFYGVGFWFNKFTLPLINIQIQYNDFAVIATFFISCCFALYSLVNVLYNYRHKNKDAVRNLSLFGFLLVSLIFVIKYSESKIIEQHPKVLILLYGFAFAKLVGHLQLAHLADAKFMQYRKSMLASFGVLGVTAIINKLFNYKIFNIDFLIVAFLIMHIAVWCHFAYYLTEELCEVLGINRFNVDKRPVQNITQAGGKTK